MTDVTTRSPVKGKILPVVKRTEAPHKSILSTGTVKTKCSEDTPIGFKQDLNRS